MGRMDKVNNQMRREISIIIHQKMDDPRMSYITITHVDVSPDLKNAKVYFSVLGDENNLIEAVTVLNNARGLIRHMVSQQIQIRHTPEIYFIQDDSMSMEAKIEETIREANDKHEKN
ncbi:MAG: 30S ribosome-binding factor RbfA [Candidatus Omnitrophica bacterium]|nr:30S ribosome-binding factor RbfA [Candidatus Omnitrophota bacterium]